MILNWKLQSYWLVFILLEDVINAAKMKSKLQSHPALYHVSHNNDIPFQYMTYGAIVAQCYGSNQTLFD